MSIWNRMIPALPTIMIERITATTIGDERSQWSSRRVPSRAIARVDRAQPGLVNALLSKLRIDGAGLSHYDAATDAARPRTARVKVGQRR